MSTKNRRRLKLTLYVVALILAELIQTSVFGSLRLGFVPCVMPVAVACISMLEGAETGGIYGLIGGCLWAWSTQLSYYGAWCILVMTAVGVLTGLITERFLLRGVQTALALSAGAVVITDGLYTLTVIIPGHAPASALVSVFLPGLVTSLLLCLIFYPLTAHISRIGGSYG